MIDFETKERITVPHARVSALQFVKEQGAKKALADVHTLLGDQNRSKRMFGLYILQHSYPASMSIARKHLPIVADDESWEVRETVAMVLRRLLEKDFGLWFPIIKKMGTSDPVNVRRAAIVGSMIKTIDTSQAAKIWDLYLPHLKSREIYIKKNLGPFALAHLAIKQPDQVFGLMRALSISKPDEMVAWNILMAFSQRLGKQYPDKAWEFLLLAQSDDRVAVVRAVRSIQRKLGLS